MPLNFTHPDIRVTIGPDDWTDWIVVLRVSEGRFDPQQPYTKTGEFEIVPTTKPFPANPSHRENKTYWRPFHHPVKIYLQDELIATLRIQKYLWKNDGDRWSGRGELVDLFAKLDTASPTSDFGLPMGSSDLDSANAAIGSRGGSVSGGLGSDSNNLPLVKRDDSPAKFAAEIYGFNGMALYVNENEVIGGVSYSSKDPAFRLPREGVDEFEFQDDAETYDQVVVSGSRQKFQRNTDEQEAWTFDLESQQYGEIPTVAIADGKYVEGNGPSIWGLIGTTRNWKNGIESEGTVTTVAAGALWTNSPLHSGSQTQILSESKTITNNYDGSGRLRGRTTTSEAAEGALYPAEREGRVNVVTFAQISETWQIDPFDEYVKEYRKVESKRALTSVPSNGEGSPELTHTDLREYTHTLTPLTTTSIIVETWRPSNRYFSTKANNQPWIHQTIEYGEGAAAPMDSEKGRIKRGGLKILRSDVELVDGPPKVESRPPRLEVVDEPFKVTVVAKDASQPYRVLEVSDDRIDTDIKARSYGAMLLRIYWGRYYGRFVTLPARIRYWPKKPLECCHIDTQALLMEGRVLAWVRGEPAKIAFFGNHLGDIPQVPYNPLAVNADFSGPALEYLAGTPIEHVGIVVPPLPPTIALPPTQPPYSVGTVTNLPPGLSVVVVNTNAAEPSLPPYWTIELVGTPTTPSTGTATIVLEPAPQAIGQPPVTVTLPIVVIPPPDPVPPPPLETTVTEAGQSYWTSIALGTLYPNWLLSEARDNWVDLEEEVLWVDALTS